MTTLYAHINASGAVSITLSDNARRRGGAVLREGDGVLCGREPDLARARGAHPLPDARWTTLSIEGDQEVSRNHVAIWRAGGRLFARDLSTLGTSLDLPRADDEESPIRIPIEIPIGAPGKAVSFELRVGSAMRAASGAGDAGEVTAPGPVAWRDAADFDDRIRLELEAWLGRRAQGGTVETLDPGHTTGAKSSIAEGRRVLTLRGGGQLLVRFGAVPTKDLPELFRTVDGWIDEQKARFEREATCQCQGKLALVSDAIRRCHEQIVKAAEGGVRNVLLRGPTGAGKTVFTQCFRHNHRDEFRRREQAFVDLNCGAVAPGLLESELFGHVRGAFNGAVAARDGIIRAGHRGIVFLDEVGELSLAAQVSLLKVLEEKKVRPVGADRGVDADVVFISASNLDFEKAMREGRFREELYFRLAQVVVNIPPLADRPEDAEGVVSVQPGGPQLLARLEADAKEFLFGKGDGAHAPWPGNARSVRDFAADLRESVDDTGPITLAQCRAALRLSDRASAPSTAPITAPPDAPIDWPALHTRAMERALADVGNKVDNYALWSKAVFVAREIAQRLHVTSLAQMPAPDRVANPGRGADDKKLRDELMSIKDNLKVSELSVVTGHYRAFHALLTGAPHPRRTA